MDVTLATGVIAITGLILIGLLGALQLAAVLRPRDPWTIKTVYGGDPGTTDPKAYFAFNQGFAQADVLLWAPLQVIGNVGMLLGQPWGFALALAASVPYVYSAFPLFVWDRDMGFRQRYWVVTWGMWPLFGILQGAYAFARLVS